MTLKRKVKVKFYVFKGGICAIYVMAELEI